MALKAMYADIELANGTTHTVRVLLADKLAFERTARVHGWTEEKDPVTSNLFLGWAAAKRSGITKASFDDFKNDECVDFLLHNETPAGETDDPTSESGNN